MNQNQQLFEWDQYTYRTSPSQNTECRLCIAAGQDSSGRTRFVSIRFLLQRVATISTRVCVYKDSDSTATTIELVLIPFVRRTGFCILMFQQLIHCMSTIIADHTECERKFGEVSSHSFMKNRLHTPTILCNISAIVLCTAVHFFSYIVVV